MTTLRNLAAHILNHLWAAIDRADQRMCREQIAPWWGDSNE